MIREATHADIPALVEIGHKFADAARLETLAPVDDDSLAATLKGLIDTPCGILLVIDGCKGVAGGVVHPAYWNATHLTGQELFYWVEPEFRGHGGALLDRMEEEAKARGAQSWGMIALEACRPEAVGALYRRRGYLPTEHSYMKRI